jgi:hypothetical protein
MGNQLCREGGGGGGRSEIHLSILIRLIAQEVLCATYLPLLLEQK